MREVQRRDCLGLRGTATEVVEDFARLRFDELQDWNEVKVPDFPVNEFRLPEQIELLPCLVAQIVPVSALKQARKQRILF